MELAINYSPAAAKLVKKKDLPIDRFKCPDWPWMVEEALRLKPVAVHFTLSAGSGKLHETDWELVGRLMEQTGTPYVNMHIDPLQKDFPGIPLDTRDPAHVQLVTERLVQDVGAAFERFGADKMIAENVTYYGPDNPKISTHDKTLRPGVLPEVIRTLLDETGCGLLLDIPHARIAAHYLGVNEREYFASLPVERIKEMHVTGLHTLENGYLQDHLAMLESDWPSLDWVLERIHSGEWATSWLLAFEYGGVGKKFEWRSDPQVIAAQVPQLAQRLNGFLRM
ncbi:MAG: hypothetical protein A2W36_05305 [Chloroflexi bacterium RBG_16_58_14]|nr:MAG: hypothetical protein A2W36_05305 [Chloroflexi bacterium RBG_16_58_14]